MLDLPEIPDSAVQPPEISPLIQAEYLLARYALLKAQEKEIAAHLNKLKAEMDALELETEVSSSGAYTYLAFAGVAKQPAGYDSTQYQSLVTHYGDQKQRLLEAEAHEKAQIVMVKSKSGVKAAKASVKAAEDALVAANIAKTKRQIRLSS
jgi:hypothetical protein